MSSGVGGASRGMTAWVAPVTAMTFVLGAFAALALKTQNSVRTDNLPSSRYSGLAEAYLSLRKTIGEDQATIGSLRTTNTRLTDTVVQGSPRSQVLSDAVKQAQFMAGLTEATGPGVVVTLSDSKRAPAQTGGIAVPPSLLMPFIIHDRDIANVVNELRAGGGEVYAINGQRVIATTAIRCVGPAIQVNGIPMTPPYKITAIGDPSVLYTTLYLTGGIVDSYKSFDPAMISVQKAQKLFVPAYDGAVQFRYAKAVAPNADARDSSATGGA